MTDGNSTFLTLLNSRRIVLVMSLPDNEPELASAAIDSGADVLKVHINLEHRASGLKFGTLEEERSNLEKILDLAGKSGVPVGIVPGAMSVIDAGQIQEVEAFGFDFVSAYAHHLSPAVLSGAVTSRVAKMIAADSTYSVEEIEAMARVEFDIVEASIIPPEGYGEPLSCRDLLSYQNIVGWTGKPVVVPTQRRISPEDVPALVATGIRAIMLGAVVTGCTPENIATQVAVFRRSIDELF